MGYSCDREPLPCGIPLAGLLVCYPGHVPKRSYAALQCRGKTPSSQHTVSHTGGKTRHMRGHILVSRLTDHQNMLPCCTKYSCAPKAYRQQSTHTAGSMWGQSGPFSRLLRQAGHTVGQFCNPGTTGGTTPTSVNQPKNSDGIGRLGTISWHWM